MISGLAFARMKRKESRVKLETGNRAVVQVGSLFNIREGARRSDPGYRR